MRQIDFHESEIHLIRDALIHLILVQSLLCVLRDMSCNHEEGGIVHAPASPEDTCSIKTAEWPLLERKCQCFLSDPSISGTFKHTVCVFTEKKNKNHRPLQCPLTVTSLLDASGIHMPS